MTAEEHKKNVEKMLENLKECCRLRPEDSDARLLHFALSVELALNAMYDYINALGEKNEKKAKVR